MNIDFERFVYILVTLAAIGVILLSLQKLRDFSKLLYSIILILFSTVGIIYLITYLAFSGLLITLKESLFSETLITIYVLGFYLIGIYIVYRLIRYIFTPIRDYRYSDRDDESYIDYLKKMNKNIKSKD